MANPEQADQTDVFSFNRGFGPRDDERQKDAICTALALGHPDPRLDHYMAAVRALIDKRTVEG